MKQSFPQTSLFQENWQSQRGTDLFNPNALQIESAKEFMRSYTNDFRLQLNEEIIPLENALGRILSKPIIANMNVPFANNSAMDGYAIDSSVLQTSSTISLKMIGKQLAGQALDQEIINNFQASKNCLRIMTGALMPNCCDTVVTQEFVIINEDSIEFDSSKIRAGENFRKQGEDLKVGDVVLQEGRILRPSDLGLIASLGFPTVCVKKKITVAYFSTGDEVTPLGEALKEGTLYDSNRYTLLGMLSQLGFNLLDLGIIRDNPDALKDAFTYASLHADAIITSGGVSVGEADFTKKIMRELGDVAFWTLAIKPGRPMAFGKIKNKDKEAVLFGLPGNPVAVMVTFYQFVQDILLFMNGANHLSNTYSAKLDGAFHKKLGRTEFLRGILYRNNSNELWVKPHGHQGSGILRSMSEADCLIVLPADKSTFEHGQSVDISAFTN